MRFYLSKEKMKRIFAKHPEVRSHYLEEVHGQGLPRTAFWALLLPCRCPHEALIAMRSRSVASSSVAGRSTRGT